MDSLIKNMNICIFRFETFLVLLGVLVFASGCSSSRDLPLNISADSNSFTQSPGTSNTSLDILFVIDSSGSMKPHQDNLAANITSFIQAFQIKNFDFQLGVTTTDTKEWLSDPSKLVQGALLEVPGKAGKKILTGTDPDLVADFQALADVGIVGTGDEKPFDAIELAFTERMTDGSNDGFLRSDSFLAIIIITDEDDGSRPAGVAADNSKDGDRAGHYAISNYTTLLDSVTSSSDSFRRYSVSAIGAFDAACWNSQTWMRHSKRVKELTEATDGINGSVCDSSFADALDEIQSKVSSLSTRFVLSSIPQVNTISVKVNGVVVPQDSANGWTYDATSNSIVFHGTQVPAQGAGISVDFVPESASA